MSAIAAQAGSIDIAAAQAIAVSGRIFANGVVTDPTHIVANALGGSIHLQASRRVDLTTAVLDASGEGGAGRIHIQADGVPTPINNPADNSNPTPIKGAVLLSTNTVLRVNSPRGQAGRVEVEGDDITLDTGTLIEAKGATAGGTVWIGGGWQGSGPLRHATTVTMSADSTIDVSATDNGNGGEVVLWSDVHNANSVTAVNGSIYAKGGVYGGDGGKVETSGHLLRVDGISIDTSAATGSVGNWLLDPMDIRINASGPNYSLSTASGTTTIGGNGSNDGVNSYIAHTTIESALASNNVTIQSTSGASIITQGDGTITYNGSARTLTLSSSGNIGFEYAPAYPGGITGSNLSVVLQATGNISTDAAINIGGTLTANAIGSITQGSTGVITANALVLGSSNGGTNKPLVTLNANNKINNLEASNLGSLSLTNAQALTVNSNGLNVAGAVSLSVTGDMTVNGAIAFADTSALISTNDILVNANITKTAGADATLTVKSARHLSFSTNTSLTSSSNKLNIVLNADSDKSGDGFIKYSGPSINTNGGSLQFGVGDTALLNGVTVYVGGDVYFDGSTAQTVTTGGGAMSMYGETLVANPSGLTLNSGSGGVRFYGVVNSASQIFTGINYGSGISWLTALDLADNVANSYLASISSRLENSMAALSVSYNTAWIGGRRNSSGVWKWEAGPLAGQAITYTNWASGEPNNCCTTIANGNGFYGENAMQFTGSNGNWNDLFDNAGAGQTLNWYVRATTLNSSPLTVTSTGNVTFDKAVGVNKTLTNLSVTGNQVTFSDALKLDSTGVTITNSGASFIASSISGAGALTKNGTGALTLSANNTYAGATTINAGSLLVGTGSSTGSLGSGAITNNGSLVFNRSGSLVVASAITGSGSLTKQVSGALSLTAANGYSGGTTLTAGTLGLYNNTAAGTGAITAADGTKLMFGRAVNTVANNFTLNGSVTFELSLIHI